MAAGARVAGGGPPVGHGRKTVRRYVDRARACGLDRGGGACQLTDELLAAVIAGVRPSRPNGKSQAWETIAARHEQIKAWLKHAPGSPSATRTVV